MEREFITVKSEEMNILRSIIELKQTECFYCHEKINFKTDKYSIFNKPDRLICNSPLCIIEAMNEDED